MSTFHRAAFLYPLVYSTYLRAKHLGKYLDLGHTVYICKILNFGVYSGMGHLKG